MKLKVKPLEYTLPLSDRRKRARLMDRMTVGCNAPTKRQIRRMSSGRKEVWLLRRMLKKQGMTMADLA